jgi:hypothetical protein
MPVNHPSLADPEIASATFRLHLDQLWATGRPARLRWERIDLDELHTIVTMPGERPDGERDLYHLRLGADYYDAAPPTAAFVDPQDWAEVGDNNRWFPVIEERPGWFGLHGAYGYPDGVKRQLICCSVVAQFYMTDHSPKETEIWQQGKDTVAATLNRIAEMLGPRHYRRPSQ